MNFKQVSRYRSRQATVGIKHEDRRLGLMAYDHVPGGGVDYPVM
jgi:hypothetical protein